MGSFRNSNVRLIAGRVDPSRRTARDVVLRRRLIGSSRSRSYVLLYRKCSDRQGAGDRGAATRCWCTPGFAGSARGGWRTACWGCMSGLRCGMERGYTTAEMRSWLNCIQLAEGRLRPSAGSGAARHGSCALDERDTADRLRVHWAKGRRLHAIDPHGRKVV